MARQDRRWEIKRRRSRRAKLAKLRKRYAKARTNDERNKIIGKVRRVAPTVSTDQLGAAKSA